MTTLVTISLTICCMCIIGLVILGIIEAKYGCFTSDGPSFALFIANYILLCLLALSSASYVIGSFTMLVIDYARR